MSQRIPSRVPSRIGRLSLMGMVMLLFLCSVLSLFWLARGGRIHPDGRKIALVKLIGVYLPILSLMGAFYFGGDQNRRRTSTTAMEAFAFALIVTSLWVIAPLFLLWCIGPIEDVLDHLEMIKPIGDTLTLAAIGFYFSKA